MLLPRLSASKANSRDDKVYAQPRGDGKQNARMSGSRND